MAGSDEHEHAGLASTFSWGHNVYEYLEAVRPFLAARIGSARRIEDLQTFLDGYQAALAINNLEERDCPPFELFFHWLIQTQPGAWAEGWAKQLLRECAGDNEVALDRFFKLVGEFGSFRPIEGEFVDVEPGNLVAEGAVKESFGPRLPARVRLIYLLPRDLCYARMTCLADQSTEYLLFSDAETAKTYLQAHFGVSLDGWQRE
jgi:hypothetical protein